MKRLLIATMNPSKFNEASAVLTDDKIKIMGLKELKLKILELLK